jgi:excisionase family DNA binding protein
MAEEGPDFSPDEAPSERARQLREELFGEDFTTAEAAYILGFEDKATVLRYAREGRLRGYQLGREWRFPKSSLVAFKDELLAQPWAGRRHAEHATHSGHAGHPTAPANDPPRPDSPEDEERYT